MDQPQTIPDIITLENKEKFRRKLLISTRIIAVLLVLAIFYIGYIQIKYVADVNKVKAKYGSLGYCYYCGLESYRKCECQYITSIQTQTNEVDYKHLAKQTADYNVADCPIKESEKKINYNLSSGFEGFDQA